MNKTQLRLLKAATARLTKWDSSKNAFGHFKVIKAKATNTKGADKIYEFYCLMRILEDLRVYYNISLHPGTRTGKIFPEAPSPKKGWPYFIIQQKAETPNKFQVCFGTEIKLSKAPKTTIAPDISIQKHDSTDDPDETMVELIMDAKFKYKITSTLSIEQIHAFMQRIKALDTMNVDTLPLFFNKFKDLKSNCLLTNGKALTHQEDYCKLNKTKQVEQFDLGTTYNVVG